MNFIRFLLSKLFEVVCLKVVLNDFKVKPSIYISNFRFPLAYLIFKPHFYLEENGYFLAKFNAYAAEIFFYVFLHVPVMKYS